MSHPKSQSKPNVKAKHMPYKKIRYNLIYHANIETLNQFKANNMKIILK
jgi:hypothetical protein